MTVSPNISLRDLVIRAQAGDSYAMNDAIEATMGAMRRYAENFARQHRVDVADLESAMGMATKRCVEQFNPTLGTPIEHMIRNAWAKEAKNVLIEMMKRKERLPIVDGGEEAIKDDVRRESAEVEAVVSQTVEAMIARLNAVDVNLGMVAQLLAYGVPYDQIASACGERGSRDRLVSWTRRAIDEIRRRLADEGDTVRIYRPGHADHGKEATVVGHASARTPFSHVLDVEGRKRAYKANEIEIGEEGR